MASEKPLKLYYVDFERCGMALCFARSKEEAFEILKPEMRTERRDRITGSYKPIPKEDLLDQIREQEVAEGFSYRCRGDEL